jgi:hypothetical protein
MHRAILACLLLLLVPGPGSAGGPSSPGDDARLRGDWEKARADQARIISDNARRIAEIYATEGGVAQNQRAEKITRNAIATTRASLRGSSEGQRLAQVAETASRDARALAELYGAQAEYASGAADEWADGAERKKLRQATGLLQANLERIKSHLTLATEAADTLSSRLPQSGVPEKVAQLEAATRDARARLSARWELERAARERDREQREREAAERARGQRR